MQPHVQFQAHKAPISTRNSDVVAAAGDTPRSSFIEQTDVAAVPVATLLAEHDELRGYAAAFESAQIDSDLAADLNVSELLSVLGTAAPLGHALKLRRVLADAAQAARKPRPRIPAGPAWQVTSRITAVGVCDDKLGSSFVYLQELNVIAASLYMSVCLPTMHNLPTECMDGSECRTLRAVNAILWAVATACFITSTGGGWIMLIVVQAVSDTHMAKWCEDHFRLSALPTTLFVTGVTVTPVAVCSQLLTGSLGGSSYAPAVRWAVLTIVMAVGWALSWFIWIAAAKSTYGVKWSEFLAFQMGAFGAYLPQRQLAGGRLREDVPYVDLRRRSE